MQKIYSLFFSWQSDREELKKEIGAALDAAKEKLYAEGIILEIESDNRNNTTQSGDITEHIRKCIDKCDVFLADVTPVQKLNEGANLKLIPNPNVMFELGYASCLMPASRIIRVADFRVIDNICHMPFDVNHTSIIGLEDITDVDKLIKSLKELFAEIDSCAKEPIPEYDCLVSFADGSGTAEIHPKYRQIYYTAKRPQLSRPGSQATTPAMAALSGTSAILDYLAKATALPEVVRPGKIEVVNGHINRSFCELEFELRNCGESTLDDCDVFIWSDTQGVVFADENEKKNFGTIHVFSKGELSSDSDGKTISARVDSLNATLGWNLGRIFIKVPADVETATLRWKVAARQFRKEGSLTLKSIPEFDYDTKEDASRAGETIFEDFIENLTA